MERDERIVGRKGLGLIHVYDGHGKGKTTAALGVAVRAVGAGKRVAIVYFDKGGTHYAEREAVCARFVGAIDICATGRDRIDARTGRFDFSITDEDREEGRRALQIVLGLFERGEHDLVVLDEINSSANLGIVEEDACLAVLARKPDAVECILTGRDAPESFCRAAHLVTRMELVKHYFYSGVPAREGIDY